MTAQTGQFGTGSRILKEDYTFAVLNPAGDINGLRGEESGLFHRDTRHLSHYELRVSNDRPVLLSSKVRRDNTMLAVDMANPEIDAPHTLPMAQEHIHFFRSQFLWRGVCYERLRIRNYGLAPTTFLLQYVFDADFADIFEVRGQRRRNRGTRLKTNIEGHSVILAYEGLDGQVRSTRIAFDPEIASITPTSASCNVSLGPGDATTLFVTINCQDAASAPDDRSFTAHKREARHAWQAKRSRMIDIATSNELFNQWLDRSTADLYMLVSETEHGPYPFAGTPWFSCPFGRDGIVTALLCLWADPSIAKGVLGYLAASQAAEVDPAREAEPGKILHESREGEMAVLGEVPFARYYGSVDATPLFVMLAGAYFERSGDRAFIERIWPNIEAALAWMDGYGDSDGDGFVEYSRQTPTGLVNQGWKDSEDSIFHADGHLAEGPIALCEVQAYVYDARRQAARMMTALGKTGADALEAQARDLKARFEERFWCEELSTYGIALDGEKRLCRVRASNAGHALLGGIASEERAAKVAESLMNPDFFSGWGIRTIAAAEHNYNPMAYHNGSVWPHDNALIALGLGRYGMRQHVLKVLSGTFDTATFMELHRLPELFCGFARRTSEGPIFYPTACAPQAWASATVIGLLGAALGISFDFASRQVRFDRPLLPAFLQELRIRNVTIGDGALDLVFRHQPGTVSVDITGRRGQVDVLVAG